MKLIKTSFFSAIITVIRIGSGFIASKAIAVFAGPSGVAIIGAFTNFITIILTFANGAINTGVVKYTAEHNNDEEKLKSIFSTSLKISSACSIIFGIPLILFSTSISNLIFTDIIYSGPIRVLGVTIIFYSINSLFISILNGKEQIKTYTIVNTSGSLLGLIFTVALVYLFEIEGALYSMVLTQTIVFFVTLTLIVRSDWFTWSYFNQFFDKAIAINLSRYSLMAIVSALTVPLSQIVLRNIIIEKYGITDAGYWQGIMRISDGYLLLITTSLSTYYLPKLSSLKLDREIRQEIFSGYKLIIPSVLLGCFIIYFSRFFLINLLYTQEFNEMHKLFLWQLIGDFFKMCSWILAYLMLAKSMTKAFILTEISFSFSNVLLSYFFLEIYKLEGVTIAFALNYFIYFLTMLFIFRKLILTNNK